METSLWKHGLLVTQRKKLLNLCIHDRYIFDFCIMMVSFYFLFYNGIATFNFHNRTEKYQNVRITYTHPKHGIVSSNPTLQIYLKPLAIQTLFEKV